MAYPSRDGPGPRERDRDRRQEIRLPTRRAIWTPFVLAVVAVVLIIVFSVFG